MSSEQWTIYWCRDCRHAAMNLSWHSCVDGPSLSDNAEVINVVPAKQAHRSKQALTGEQIERLASAAFEWDRKNGHIKGGPRTWHMLPEYGRENYRSLVRAVLAEMEALNAPSERVADHERTQETR